MADLDYLAGFLRENRLEAATVTTDSEADGYPVTDVLDRRHDLPWRTEAGTATAKFAFPSPISLGAFCFRFPSERDPDVVPAPRFKATDSITIRASNTLGASDLLNVAFPAGHHHRLGYAAYVRIVSGALAPVTARYWECQFTSSAAWFEVESIWADTVWHPAFNYNRGANFGIDENAEIGRSTFTGGAFAEARSRLLEFVGQWSIWTANELNQWEEFQLEHGLTRPFVLFRRLTGDLSKRISISTFDGKPVLNDQDGTHFLLRAQFKENR